MINSIINTKNELRMNKKRKRERNDYIIITIQFAVI